MKNIHRFKIVSVVLLVSYVLAACAGTPATATNVGGGKAVAQPVTYLGVIESINGDQWTINGVTVTVSESVVRDGPFSVGDQIKVEATIDANGSLLISRVEAASPAELSTLPQLGNDNDANVNDDNSNVDNSNVNSNDANANDDNSNELLNSNDNSNGDDDLNSNDDNSSVSNANGDDDNDNSHGAVSNSNDDDHRGSSGSGSNSNDDDDHSDDDNSNG